MRKVVINGANGYVASHFTHELLTQNFEVAALVRDSNYLSSGARMKTALAEVSENIVPGKNLKVYSYSLFEKDFSLTSAEMHEIFNRPADFFHFAACLKFNAKDQDEIFRTNVDGVENAIKIFMKYSKPGSRFFFISSVYSCGRFSELFEEKFYGNENIGGFRNYYEQSKRYAENVIKKYMENDDLNGYIIRLSQVVGNNKTGVTKTDYGVFDFARRISSLASRFPGQTIRIRTDPNSTQNLIAIDSVVHYLMKIPEITELPEIVNMVGKKPVTNRMIADNVCKYLPIRIIQDTTVEKEQMNILERKIAAGMSFTGDYANSHLHFGRKNLEQYFSPNGNEVTEQSLSKMIEYFVNNLEISKKKETVKS